MIEEISEYFHDLLTEKDFFRLNPKNKPTKYIATTNKDVFDYIK